MTPPTPTRLAVVFTALAPKLTGGFGQARIFPDGIRIDVTDPAIQHRIVADYGLTRDDDLAGHYAGNVGGVIVTVTLTIPTGIIPAQHGRAA